MSRFKKPGSGGNPRHFWTSASHLAIDRLEWTSSISRLLRPRYRAVDSPARPPPMMITSRTPVMRNGLIFVLPYIHIRKSVNSWRLPI